MVLCEWMNCLGLNLRKIRRTFRDDLSKLWKRSQSLEPMNQRKEQALTRFCRSYSIVLASALLCFGIGCKQEGSVEQAGKKVDETVEKTGQVMKESKEKVEEVAEKAKEMEQEAIEKVKEAAK